MRKSKKVTLKEVASAVNLAVPTVSQILNNRKNFCSAEQCRRVRETAQQMGYVTNIGYRIMTGQETRTVGIMVANPGQMQENHCRTLVLTLMHNFAKNGCAAFCSILPSDGEKACEEVRTYIGRGVERFIFIGAPDGKRKILDMLTAMNIPFIGNAISFSRYIIADSFAGRNMLLEHIDKLTDGNFLMCWHKSSLQLIDKQLSLSDRKEYFLSKLHLIEDCQGDFYEESFRIGYETVEHILDNHPEIKGVSMPNDALAIGAARCIIDRKISGFHITGCNGEKELKIFPYPVSTAVFDMQKIADLMAERIFDPDECKIAVPTEMKLFP